MSFVLFFFFIIFSSFFLSLFQIFFLFVCLVFFSFLLLSGKEVAETTKLCNQRLIFFFRPWTFFFSQMTVMQGTVHERMPVSTLTSWSQFSAAFICNRGSTLDSSKGLLMITKYALHKHRWWHYLIAMKADFSKRKGLDFSQWHPSKAAVTSFRKALIPLFWCAVKNRIWSGNLQL